MKEIRIPMSDKEHEQLVKSKNGRTWKEMLQDEADLREEQE